MADGVDEDKRATLRRFAALGAASPLVNVASAEESPEDPSEARGAIIGYLAATPGAHFSKLRDDLKLGTGEAQHHLRRLADDGTITSRRDGDYRRFFPAGRFSAFEQRALGYLRKETPRGMLVELLRDPDATGQDIAAALDVSTATISSHAADLADAGLLSREGGYTVRRPETVLTLLVRYADSFGPRAVAFANEADAFVAYDP
ncbi:MAG: winged helix-turn-helix transcriptional regulator [Halobacteriaceae archaeon]